MITLNENKEQVIHCDACGCEYPYMDDQNFKCSYCGNMVHEEYNPDDGCIYDPNQFLLESDSEFDKELYLAAEAHNTLVLDWN